MTGTGPVAVAEVKQVTVAGTISGTYTGVSVSIDGTTYTGAATGNTATTLASDAARLINSVLGDSVASASSGVITITAPKAGTPLPLLNIAFSGGTGATDTWATLVSNNAVNSVATAAAAVAAPTGVTSYTAVASGVANVSAATTSTIDVTGTAVQTSGGSDVKVTASDSVFVSGAKGAVTVKTGTTATTLYGAVAADTATGVAGDAAGVYVSGGTTVAISGTSKTGAVKVGTTPFAIASVNATGGLPELNGSVSRDPTGDVSITRVTTRKSRNQL